MELYQRIRTRREELGMSQDELAKKMGYKSRSSINKIELGKNDISQSKIARFAEALDTTPECLLGLNKHTEKYEFATDLIGKNYDGIMHWSEELGMTEDTTSAVRSHFADLLSRYKKLVEDYTYAHMRWKNERNDYLAFYKKRDSSLSEEKIREIYYREELERDIGDLKNWVNAFPSWISRCETDADFWILRKPKENEPELMAAHENPAGATPEQKKHADDIMMDDSEWE